MLYQTQDADQAAPFDGFFATCRAGMVLFDIGAHFGIFSGLALITGYAATVVAVDSSPTSINMIPANAAEPTGGMPAPGTGSPPSQELTETR